MVVTKLEVKTERKGALVTEEREREEMGNGYGDEGGCPPTNVR